MSDTHTRSPARTKGRPSSHRSAAEPSAAPARKAAPAAPLGAHYAAGPVVGLGAPVQTKLAISQAGDAFEREADAVAHQVTSGAAVAPPSSRCLR